MTIHQIEDLILKINTQNEGFEELYSVSRPIILKTVRSLNCYCSDGDDIVQEVMVAVFDKISDLREPKCYLKWLKLITFSKYYRFYRKNDAFKSYIEFENLIGLVQEDPVIMLMDQLYAQYLIETTMKTIKPKYQIIVNERYIEELSMEEISEKEQLALGTVKSRLFYAKKMLQANNVLLNQDRRI